MLKTTALYANHQQDNAKLVDFAGWHMPLHYGSQLKEHNIVRESAGMFDVSHMGVVDVQGTQAKDYLRYILANDVAKLTQPGKALYSCLLNENGGIIDDLIVYYLEPNAYRIVVNAGTKEKDWQWLQLQAKQFDVVLAMQPDLSIIALQGPKAIALANSLFPESSQEALKALKPFFGIDIDDIWVARTGYTGEDGYEIILPNAKAAGFWDKAKQAGLQPCGLGARDTLRLEAGFNLYGSDMDETTTPYESNLAWTVVMDEQRNFVGKKALQNQLEQGIKRALVGLVLEERGVLRAYQTVQVDSGLGEITSGTFSPTLQKSVAFARIPVTQETKAKVQIRDAWFPVRMTKPAFVRQGKSLVD